LLLALQRDDRWLWIAKRCETFVEQLEGNARVAALVPGAVRTLAEVRPSKKGKRGCRFGANCRRHAAFAAGGTEPDCPDGH
jgi:hypothetical protein